MNIGIQGKRINLNSLKYLRSYFRDKSVMNLDFLKLSYCRKNGVSLGFVLNSLFIKNFNSVENEVIFILYAFNMISKDTLKNDRSSLSKAKLLQIIFDNSRDERNISKDELRKMSGLKKDTFNKSFKNIIIKLQLQKRRIFNVEEVYLILKDYYAKDSKWLLCIIPPVNKKRLAVYFTNGKYDKLEELIIDCFPNMTDYKSNRYMSPSDIQMFVEFLKNKVPNKVEEFYQENNLIDDVLLMLYIFLWYNWKTLINKNNGAVSYSV